MKTPIHSRPLATGICALLALMPFLNLPSSASAAAVVSTWNVASGNWDVAANWNPNADFPNNDGDGNTYSAVLNNSGTVTLNTDIIVENYTQSNGTLSGGAFTLTVNQLVSWTGGTIGGSGTVTATGGFEISGATTKTLGNGSNTGRVLTNNGTADLSGGNLLISSSGGAAPGSQFVNNATFNVTDDADISNNNFGGTTGAFTNAATGIFNKSGAGTTTTIGATFTNSGTVNIDGGALSLTGGSTSSGSFAVDPGATLSFAGGTHTLNAGSSVNGAGTVSFTSGTTNVNGTYSVTGLTTISGTANFNGPAPAVAALDLISGTLGGSSPVAVSGLLHWTGGTMGDNGTTTANGGLTLDGSGSKTLGNGSNTGRVLTNNGTADLSGGNLLISSSGGATPGSQFVNNATFNVTDDADISNNNFGGTTGAFTNAATGIFNKSGAGTTTTIGATFTNSGTVNIDGGALSLTGGSTSSGSFAIDPSTTLNFAGGTHTLDASSSVAGAGAVSFTSGTVNVNGTYNLTGLTTVSGTANFNGPAPGVAALDLTAGTLGGSSPVAVSGLLHWTGGTMGDNGTTTANGGLTLDGSGSKTLGNGSNTGRVLTNNGTADLSGGNLLISSSGGATPGSQFVNNATFNVTDDADISNNNFGGTTGAFTNAATGIFNKSGGGTTTTVSAIFNNAGTLNATSGTLNLTGVFTQTAGSLNLIGGDVSTNTSLALNGGLLTGNGTITGGVENNAGTISPGLSAGALAITSNLTLGGNSTLEIELGGIGQGTSYDFISEGGTLNLTLGGLVNVRFIGGFESLVQGNQAFTILTSNQPILGNFSNVVGGRIAIADGLGSFAINTGTNSNSVILTGFIPEPGIGTLLACGLGAMLARRRRA